MNYDPTKVIKPEGCICAVFSDVNFRIADLTCPAHGIESGHPCPDGPWDIDPDSASTPEQGT